jgi:hypothetical protein
LLVYYHWVEATVWWTVSQQSPRVFTIPVSKYFGTKNRKRDKYYNILNKIKTGEKENKVDYYYIQR